MTVTAINWDQWRKDYDRMSFAEHQAFNAECLRLHPVQRSFDSSAASAFLAHYTPSTVVELGGWDGALAAETLTDTVEQWTNYDITPDVPQACDDPRYSVKVLDNWAWRTDVTADALIASHVFEHMRMWQVIQLLTYWHVDVVFADVPLYEQGTDWSGYEGSHILEVGMRGFVHGIEKDTPFRCVRGAGTTLWLERDGFRL